MPISIVVGGQFGSEGKGKVAHYLAQKQNATVAVRCGGTNSGHTVIDDEGNTQVFRQLPTAAVLPETQLALCAGSYIDVDILEEEISRANVKPKRLKIDPYAVIITDEHKTSENSSGLVGDIGSTASGTGAAVFDRIKRGTETLFAKDVKELSQYIQDVNSDLRARLTKGQRVILEGTQGFGLSPLHSRCNPYVTSRDTTAAGFLSEVGLSPFDVDDVVMVIRTFPIRVGGNSGPLPKEIDWDTLSREMNLEDSIYERTSVTKHIRRVARFDPAIVKRAIESNKPSTIVMNHMDYLPELLNGPEQQLYDFIQKTGTTIGAHVDYLGFGPSQHNMRRLSK